MKEAWGAVCGLSCSFHLMCSSLSCSFHLMFFLYCSRAFVTGCSPSGKFCSTVVDSLGCRGISDLVPRAPLPLLFLSPWRSFCCFSHFSPFSSLSDGLSGKEVRMLYRTSWCRLFRREMQVKAIISIKNNRFLEVTPHCLLLS